MVKFREGETIMYGGRKKKIKDVFKMGRGKFYVVGEPRALVKASDIQKIKKRRRR